MKINELPTYDPSDNLTGCCPRFHPEGWEGQELHFQDKPFVRASTVSVFHMPLNMGAVFTKTWRAIQEAHAEGGGFLVLSHDDSPWHADHLFAVSGDVPGADMVHLTGTYKTHVFEGPFSDAGKWAAAMKEKEPGMKDLFFFYTTCPKCAKVYGKNYVVGVAQVDAP